MSETTLYTREGDYIPRVVAVHDLCGYGKCSLGAVSYTHLPDPSMPPNVNSMVLAVGSMV